MIARPSHWRHGGGGRESLAPSGAAAPLGDRVRSCESRGKITSRPAYSREELEYLAFRLGWSVVAVKKALAEGLL